MGVAKSDDLGVRERLSETERRRRPKLISMCDHRHQPVKLELDHLGKAGPQLEAICIAVDGCDRSEGLQLMEETDGPDISAMENAVDPSEHGEHLRS
jgi:hypothetical protein